MSEYDEIDAAGSAFEALADGPALRAASAIEQAFERTGVTIERSLSQAAKAGELSFSKMTEAILKDLTRLAMERFIEKPIEQLLDGALSSLSFSGTGSFSGARADGGPVNGGGAYLVGERGPEMFVPHSSGSIEQFGPRVVVNITLGQGVDVRQVEQSQGRITTALARAVAKGSRHL